jgi:hypothetical protein
MCRLTFPEHTETINILNLHAGVRADNNKSGTCEFYARFAEFIQLFQASNYDESYLNGDPTDVTRAYWSILGCKTYVNEDVKAPTYNNS